MNDELTHFLRLLRPSDASNAQDVFPLAWRRELLERLPDTRGDASTKQGHRASSWPARIRQPKLRRQLRLVPVLGVIAAAAASATGLLAGGSAIAPSEAIGAVAFRTSEQGDVIATVKNPFAAQNQLNEAFARHGFDITVNLVPVSASLVGTVVYTSEEDIPGAIQPLLQGSCLNGGGGCAIGVKIDAGFKGHGYITLGRPARPGESYESQASAFAPGEPLHCSGLLGASAANAAKSLEARGLSVEWREDTSDGMTSHSQVLETPTSGSYVWEAVMATSGKAVVWTQPSPWPADSLHGAQFNQGC